MIQANPRRRALMAKFTVKSLDDPKGTRPMHDFKVAATAAIILLRSAEPRSAARSTAGPPEEDGEGWGRSV